MKRKLSLLTIQIILITLIISIFTQLIVFADVTSENKYYFNETVNAGTDTGYSETNTIIENDPHFGWSIGDFYISGYSANQKSDDGTPIFLKNVGDKVELWFALKQDINKLNNDESLTIENDTNGYDEYFGIERTDFKRGALIVRHKNYQNRWEEPVIYTDFLSAKTSDGAYTQVEFFEEGDYEVGLNYEIKESNLNLFGWHTLPSYHNYKMFFSFSVRNGNCMVYPFDVKTKAELTNTSFTENGFYLDFANSKYLDVNIKKEVLNEGTAGLIEDTRFNRPAKNGEKYTDEGVYTVTVHNKYTNQETVKKIYVGTDSILKAYVTTGYSIDEIRHQLSLGNTISEKGELITVASKQEPTTQEISTDIVNEPPVKHFNSLYIMVVACVCLMSIVLIFVVRRNKSKDLNKGGVSKK